MTKTRKRILIGLGSVLLVPAAGIAWLASIREPPDGPRVEAAPGVVGVEAGGAYAWIVKTANGAVLVDAGLDATGTALIAELQAQGVAPARVHTVLITHGHPDHYAAASVFSKAAAMAGAGDLAMLRGDRTHYAPFGKIIATVARLPPAPAAITPLRSGEQLVLDGARFQVVATPGHSPGSVMYLYGNVLFTGDSLMRKKDGVAIAPSLFSENSDRNRESLRALEALAFDVIADGHSGVTTGAKQKLARFLAGS